MAYSETRYGRDYDVTGTGWFVGIIVALALLAIGYLVFNTTDYPRTASAAVKVQLEKGHGSGVHIGDGLVLTAAHVASEGAIVKLKLDDGTEREATVVWASAASDVALLRTSGDGLAASVLNCAPVIVGQPVTAHGNPLNIEFIATRGHIVAGDAKRGQWASTAVVDMTILPGMSGGGVLNDRGEVVGIAVGLLTLPLGLSVSATGIGMIVPAKHICGLLGRT